jgi:diguanylate cyclase (GGDEF)-like protein
MGWFADVLLETARHWSDVRGFYRSHEWFRSLFNGVAALACVVALDALSGHHVGFRFMFIVPVFVASLRGDWVVSALVTGATFLALMVFDSQFGVLTNDTAALGIIVNFVALTATAGIIVALQRKIRQIGHLANHDALTGAMNRVAVQDFAERAIRDAESDGNPVVVAVIDCDGFKDINDRYGHAAGDEVLITLVETLQRYTGESGAIGRIGGDEFVLVFEGRSLSFVRRLLDRARDEYRDATAGITSKQGFSYGCALLGVDGASFGSLVQAADEKMYEDKAASPVTWALTVR